MAALLRQSRGEGDAAPMKKSTNLLLIFSLRCMAAF